MTFNATDKKMAMGRIPQTNYATPTAAAASGFTEQIVLDLDSSFWNIEPRKINNKGQGTGNRFATESHVEAWDTNLGYSFEASSQNIGRHLLAALGSVTSAVQGSGNKHTFSPLDTNTSMQLPPYSFLEKLAEGANGINSIYPSAVSEGIELQGDGQGRVVAAVQYRGSGKEASAASYAWATHVYSGQNNQNYFYNTQSEITIGTFPGNGSPTPLDCAMESWRFAWRNILAADAGYRPGCPEYVTVGSPESGVVRTECLLVDSEVEFEMTFRLRASDDALARLKAQTLLEGSLDITGGVIGAGPETHKLSVIFYLAKYSTHVRGVKDGIATVTVMPEILYSRTDSKIIQLELINNLASYTV